MTVTKKRAMQMFDRDLEILMDDLRGMQKHYQIADWEAFVFIRKPDCPESYVVKYAAADDAFAKQIVQLHAATPPPTPSAAVMRAADGNVKYTYCFHVWPDETWGHVAAGDEHIKIPAAVFDLFRMVNHGIEMVFTPIQFVRFRHDVGSFGLTLREITRVPYQDEETVL